MLSPPLQVNAQSRKVQEMQARYDSTQRTLASMVTVLPDRGSKASVRVVCVLSVAGGEFA